MQDRIKLLRKTLGLTQQQFANKLRIARNNIAGYETGTRNPSDAVISLICREFDVNENWLRTGEGEMFIEIDRENQLMMWAAETLKQESTSFRKRFAQMLAELDGSDWETLEKISEMLHKKD